MKIGIGLGIAAFLVALFTAQHLTKTKITVPVIYRHMPDARADGVSDYPLNKWNVGVIDANGNDARS